MDLFRRRQSAAAPGTGRSGRVPRRARPRAPEPGPGGFPGPGDGFTLVELMIAVMLLGVGVLALAQVFAVASQHTSYAREQTIATRLAEEIREKIMSEPYDTVYATFDGVDTQNPSSVPTQAQEWAAHLAEELGVYGRGQVDVATDDTDTSLIHGMLGVTVTISWREASGVVALPVHFAIAKTGA